MTTLITLVTTNLILWLSVFTYFVPLATDKQASINDNTVSVHKIDNR